MKIDPRNEKALMRKANILVELGDNSKLEPLLKQLEDVGFQSANSQLVYNHIKKVRERMAQNPTPLKNRKPVIKPKEPEPVS